MSWLLKADGYDDGDGDGSGDRVELEREAVASGSLMVGR